MLLIYKSTIMENVHQRNVYQNILELIFKAHAKNVSAEAYLNQYENSFFNERNISHIIKKLDDDRIKKMFTRIREEDKSYEIFLKNLPDILKTLFYKNFASFLAAIEQIIKNDPTNQILTEIVKMDPEIVQPLIFCDENETQDKQELLPVVDLPTALKNQPKGI